MNLLFARLKKYSQLLSLNGTLKSDVVSETGFCGIRISTFHYHSDHFAKLLIHSIHICGIF